MVHTEPSECTASEYTVRTGSWVGLVASDFVGIHAGWNDQNPSGSSWGEVHSDSFLRRSTIVLSTPHLTLGANLRQMTPKRVVPQRQSSLQGVAQPS